MSRDYDYEKEIEDGISQLWRQYSTKDPSERRRAHLDFLSPYLAKEDFHALLAALGFSDDSTDDFEEVERILDRIGRIKKSNKQLVKLSIKLESHFYLLEHSPVAARLYRDTLLALTTADNNYIGDYLIALRYLNGELGFPKDEAEFEVWIKKCVVRDEFEGVCTYVDFLMGKGKLLPVELVHSIRRGLAENPDMPEARRLLRKAEKYLNRTPRKPVA